MLRLLRVDAAAIVILCLSTMSLPHTTGLFCTTGLAAETGRPMKITSIEGISEYRLENGLKVLLFPDTSKPSVTVNLTVMVGSRHEGYGEAGMAHLLEHMLFKGTPTHPEIPKVLQQRGAQFNGTTWVDRTNYYETMPSSDENLEFALSLEADRMMNSLIRAEDLASEMTVVRNEFERGENNPQSVLFQRIMAAAFEWHNYGKSTIGNRADIERVPVENLRRFYRKYYQPDNAILVVAGRFDEAKSLALIQKTFGAIPKPERVLEATWTEEPAQDGERSVVLRRVGDVAVVGMAFHTPAGAHQDFVPIDVLETILTSQPSGRLYKALVEKKLAASVGGAAFAWHDPGVLRLAAEVTSGTPAETVLEAMIDALDVVREQGVTQDELDRARQKLLKQRELSASDSAEIAVELSEWAAQGDWRLYFLYRDRLEQVQVSDIQRVAAAYLQPSNRTVGLYIPTEQPQRTPVPATPNLVGMIGDYKGRDTESAIAEFEVSPANIESKTLRLKIDGLDVALLSKPTRGGAVVAHLTLRYGSSETLAGQLKACEFLPTLMLRGTKSLDRQQIQDRLDQNFASLVASGSTGEATFAFQTKRAHLAEVLKILRQVLREPTLPTSELELLLQQHRSEFEQQLTDPQALAVRHVQRSLSPYPSTDARYIPTVPEELALAEALKPADVENIYREFLGSHAGQIAIVGDFDPKEVEAALREMFTGWKVKQPYQRIARRGDLELMSQKEEIRIPDKANAFFFTGQVFPIRDSHPDYASLVLGNYVLGSGALSSRLGNRIRQKEGLSYGVGSVFRASALDDRATLTLYAICNPGNVPKVEKAIREELDLLLKKGMTVEELDQAKQGWLQRQEVARTDDANLVRLLEDSLFAGRTFQFVETLEGQVRALKPEGVITALRKHVSLDKTVIAVAGDLSLPSDEAKAASE